MSNPKPKLAESGSAELDKYFAKLVEAFPEVDPEFEPFADRVLVQIKYVSNVSAGGILLGDEAIQTEEDNTQIAKIISIGPTCFRNEDTLEPWPEGAWCAVGEYVRIPLYGGDRWHITLPNSEQPRAPKKIRFATFKELDLIGLVKGDPLKVTAFL